MRYTTKDLARDLGTGLVHPSVLEEFDPDLVRELKAESPLTIRTIASARREFDEEKRIVSYVSTIEVVDRLGDLVMTKPRSSIKKPKGESGEFTKGEGFLTENHKAAGAPFLWSHMARDHAIGQVTASVRKRIVTPKDGTQWATVQRVRYLFEEAIPHAVPTWILVMEKINLSVSVGFAIVEIFFPPEEMAVKLGLGRWGVIFLTSDQLELSQAQTPANQLALAEDRDIEDGEIETKALAALERAVDESRVVCGVEMTAGLLKDFRREFPLGPAHEAEILQGRLDAFFDTQDISGRLDEILEASRDVGVEIMDETLRETLLRNDDPLIDATREEEEHEEGVHNPDDEDEDKPKKNPKAKKKPKKGLADGLPDIPDDPEVARSETSPLLDILFEMRDADDDGSIEVSLDDIVRATIEVDQRETDRVPQDDDPVRQGLPDTRWRILPARGDGPLGLGPCTVETLGPDAATRLTETLFVPKDEYEELVKATERIREILDIDETLRRTGQKTPVEVSDLPDMIDAACDRIAELEARSADSTTPPELKIVGGDLVALRTAFESVSTGLEAISSLYERADKGLTEGALPPSFEESFALARSNQAIAGHLATLARAIPGGMALGGLDGDSEPSAEEKTDAGEIRLETLLHG